MAFYEFQGIPWGPMISDYVPRPSVPAPFVSERHVPYSNITVVDFGGFGPRRLACRIRVGYQDRASFEATITTTGPLVLTGVSWSLATLIKLENHQVTPLPVVAELPTFEGMYHTYDAEWIIAGTTL